MQYIKNYSPDLYNNILVLQEQENRRIVLQNYFLYFLNRLKLREVIL